MNDHDIIENFIVDEENALKKDVQGHFITMNHIQIHGMLKKSLKDISPDRLQRLFFHLIRNAITFPSQSKIAEKHFDALKSAYIDILHYAKTQPKTKGWLFKKPRRDAVFEDRIAFTKFYRLNASFLFGASDYSEQNIETIKKTSFEEYNLCLKLIKKSEGYIAKGYFGMRQDHESFKEFAENPFILQRLLQSLQDADYKTAEFPLNDLFWASIIILILAEQENVLKNIIDANKNIKTLHLLAVFLDAFDQRPMAKKLLAQLYAEHPKNG